MGPTFLKAHLVIKFPNKIFLIAYLGCYGTRIIKIEI